MTSTKTNNTNKIILITRSASFALGMMVSTAVIAPLVIISFPMSFAWRYQLTRYWTRFNIWWLEKTCKLGYEISGLENIPKGPVIVLAKHQSSWETIFLHQLLPPVAWVVKRELLWIPFFGWALALVDPIAIDRKASGAAAKQILEEGKKHLEKGQWVLLFPEGTRTAPGERRRYGAGGARLAAHTGFPILPIAHNAGEFWPRRSFIKRPGVVNVIIGPQIDSTGRSIQDLTSRAENWIENAMQVIKTVQKT